MLLYIIWSPLHALWFNSLKLEIFFHLPWQLKKNLPGQLNSIITEFLEFYKLNQISFCSVAHTVNHLAIIIIQLLHDLKFPISYSHNDNTQRQPIAFYKEVNHLLFIMDLAVCQDEQNHVLCFCFIFLEIFTDLHRISEQVLEFRWTCELQVLKNFSVSIDDIVFP